VPQVAPHVAPQVPQVAPHVAPPLPPQVVPQLGQMVPHLFIQSFFVQVAPHVAPQVPQVAPHVAPDPPVPQVAPHVAPQVPQVAPHVAPHEPQVAPQLAPQVPQFRHDEISVIVWTWMLVPHAPQPTPVVPFTRTITSFFEQVFRSNCAAFVFPVVSNMWLITYLPSDNINNPYPLDTHEGMSKH